MKQIHQLTDQEIQELEYCQKNSDKHYFRIKCQAILLSNKGYSIAQLVELFNKKRQTISGWLDSYETTGISGLLNKSGQGSKAKLNELSEQQEKELEEAVKKEPQNLNKVAAFLSEKFGFNISKWMLISYLKKKLNYSWRRIRKWLKPCQNPEEYQEKIIQLCGLLWLEKQELINLYYADESRFSMVPYIPSAWQKKGEPIAIVPNKSEGINVFGILNRNMDFYPYTSEQSINSDLVIAFIDDFATNLNGQTVLILDNASIHHSEEFEDQIERWEELGLFIFYLPRYSPHLNIIETLWRKIKYEWLKPQHYLNPTTFFANLEIILLNIGSRFNINFKDQLASV